MRVRYTAAIRHAAHLQGRRGFLIAMSSRCTGLRGARFLSAAAALCLCAALPGTAQLNTVPPNQTEQALPEAPSALLQARQAQKQTAPPAIPQIAGPPTLLLCPDPAPPGSDLAGPAAQQPGAPPCLQPEDRIQPIISGPHTGPLTRREKGILAWKDFTDPFNFITIAGYSAISVAINAHSAYGPGVKGWARLSGYGLAEDGQGEFLGTFAIPALLHEDPRYRRMPGEPVLKRVRHALAHTFVAEHDDGRPMVNYATLLTYPLSAELSNLYVPGIQPNGSATARRVLVGIATDPAGNIVAEFLPDLARRLHIRVIFIQEILNQVATGGSAPNVM